jgi:hypothetical protein
LFHLQWHDEIFPRNGQLALFDLLGSPDKQLIGYVGSHAETERAAITLWREFIACHLTRPWLDWAGRAHLATRWPAGCPGGFLNEYAITA